MRQHRLPCVITLGLLWIVASASAATLVLDPAAPATAEVSVVSESPEEIVLELRFGIVQVDSDTVAHGLWTHVSIPGATPASRSGWPELPQKSVWVQIAAEHVQAEVMEAATVRRRWGVARPAAEPLSRSDYSALRRVASPEFYERSRIFPESPVDVALSGKLGDLPVALVTFSPVQYRSNTHEWIVHTRLRVRITSRGGSHLDRSPTVLGAARSPWERLVINPPEPSDSTVFGRARMLLVTVPAYVSALQPFVQWKTQSGVPVRTILYPEVATNAAGLRAYLRALCDSLNIAPEFLLLVGDVNVIPPFFGVNSSLTDHPYSLRDDLDYLPDLAVGRIPCQGVADCADWVTRLLAYERDGVAGPTALVFASAAAQDPQHGIFVSSLFQSAGMSVDQFQEPQSGTCVNLVTSLDAGRQWVFYIGHGHAEGWSSVHPEFTTADVAQLTSQVPPITIAVACATADLDYPGMSLAEFWLARPGERGPLVYFGATEGTAFFRSDTLGIGALRAIFEHQCERMGTAADWGRLATAQCFPQGPGGVTEETIQQFMLLGDPAMRVYSAPPQALTVNCPTVVPQATTELQFTVYRAGVALSGADVCVRSDPPGYYIVQSTSALGITTIPAQFVAPILLRWTVTAHNALPASGTISVVPDSGAFVQICAVEVVDSAGDGDGRADRSEPCALRITLQNDGTTPSAPGTVTVSCADPLAAIPEHALSFAALMPRDHRALDELVPFAVAENANEGDEVLLELVIRTESGDSLRGVRPLTLHAPQMVFCGSSLSEDSGDGDGQPEGGERLLLSIRFRNQGGEDLHMPSCSLLSLPPCVQLLDVSANPTTTAPGDTLAVLARLRADSGVPRGSPLEYTYSLSAANLPPLTGWDMQRIGQVPAYLYVLDLMPQQVDGIAAALASLGMEYERGNTLPQDLFRYASVWIFCGVYPNAVALSPGSANRLAQYLNDGGRCYWEGGDAWAYDPATNLHPFFHIRGINDGTSNAGPTAGEYGTAYAQYRFEYAGENSFIDQLEPEAGALVMLRNARSNANYPVCIAYAGANYRTVGSSVEVGALVDSTYPSTRVHLVRDILSWFGIESRVDVFPPEVQHVPQAEFPFQNRPIEIAADVEDASGLDSVTLEYRVGGGQPQRSPMTLSDGVYHGVLPGARFGTTLRYCIRAVDASPRHNAAVTAEFTTVIVARPDVPFELTLDQAAFARLRPRISSGGNGSWSITCYPEDVPVLELHGGDGSTTFTTEEFDCSRLQTVTLSFWHYLREVELRSATLARVLGSTDGGESFPHVAWSYVAEQGGVQEEAVVVVPNLDWAAGQARVVLRFEFSGNWYWRLRDIRVAGRTAPVTVPVERTVIAVVPEGVKLAWPAVRGALYYEILAATSLNGEGGFQSIAQVRDTNFMDSDLSSARRYYEVRAVLEESTEAAVPESAQPFTATAPLRIPDLRWNVKLGSGTSR
jgi:hypothetical protein